MSALRGRREFLGGAALTAGALLAGVALPLSLEPPSALALALETPALASGHVDDAWGHWPPYAHPIAYGNAAPQPVDWTQAAPIDRNFLA